VNRERNSEEGGAKVFNIMQRLVACCSEQMLMIITTLADVPAVLESISSIYLIDCIIAAIRKDIYVNACESLGVCVYFRIFSPL